MEDSEILNDVGPISNYGIVIDDYKIDYEIKPKISIENKEPIARSKISKDSKGRTF